MQKLLLGSVLMSMVGLTGCVGWGPCGGSECHAPFTNVMQSACSTCDDHCGNCDGYNPPYSTIRKTLACGSGCGEIYYGDWLSNPPNTCNDCDATGYAVGINARIPWLCNPLPWFGFQHRGPSHGYGNPLRSSMVNRSYGHAHWTPNCGSGCGGVSTGCGGCSDCGKAAPSKPGDQAPKLKPIPDKKTVPPGKQVSYVMPLRNSHRGSATQQNMQYRRPKTPH